ncbi:MAG TPA: sulfite exporter TauE/SafE family protein [Gammaproteobacteria bacterium]|nr:sulfite exporter TauE/SafE family protein [Gammaproteobacteria bacterium]
MPVDVSLLSAFLVGLLGGVHCVGMCGGIVTALSLGARDATVSRLVLLLAYNGGRIGSYMLAGALFGGLGWMAAHWSGIHALQLGLQWLAALFLVAMGLYLGGWWLGLRHVEAVGAHVWRRLEPLGRSLLPVRHPGQALLLGALWGWLPCGLVYSVLVWAVSLADPVRGAILLLSFGLGTLPNLLLMGLAASRLAAAARNPRLRQLAGLLVLTFGLVSLYRLTG